MTLFAAPPGPNIFEGPFSKLLESTPRTQEAAGRLPVYNCCHSGRTTVWHHILPKRFFSESVIKNENRTPLFHDSHLTVTNTQLNQFEFWSYLIAAQHEMCLTPGQRSPPQCVTVSLTCSVTSALHLNRASPHWKTGIIDNDRKELIMTEKNDSIPSIIIMYKHPYNTKNENDLFNSC